MTRWIGTGEAAERLGVERRRIHQFIDEGRLVAARGDRAKGSPAIVVDARQVDELARSHG
jgi:hypothetical protein